MSSCVKKSIVPQKVEALPLWLNTAERFSTLDGEGNIPSHLFFDLATFHEVLDNGINYVMTTPRDSLYGYDIDLQSGRLYKKKTYCEQNDVWKSYSGTIHRPPFSTGFVPRLLDQLGGPQKILIFGDNKKFQKFSPQNSFSQRARVVGGYVEQYCKKFPCKFRRMWMSRLVLLAVNTNDSDYKNIHHLSDLKKKEDWEYVKAFIENGDGRNVTADESAPAYRMIGEIDANKAFSFALTKGHLFKFKEMKTLAKSCRKLYDHVWTTSKKLRGSKQNNNSKFSSFADFFKDFHTKYGKRYKTCQKYVKASNINNDTDRHWFFAMVSGFFHAEELGYVYNCLGNSWVSNPTLANGKRMYNESKYIQRCNSHQLDRSFEAAIGLLSGLFRSNTAHYRYIQYDEMKGGTHDKLYSWVFDSGKKLPCRSKFNENLMSAFPQDILWKQFPKGGVSTDSYIR